MNLRTLVVPLLLVLVPASARADLLTTTAAGDVVRLPYPSGTPASVEIASGTGGMTTAYGMTRGSDGYLYVASFGTNEVLRFNTDGTRDCGFEWPSISGFTGPTGLRFGPDGRLYVSGLTCGRVVSIDVSFGTWSDVFPPFAIAGLQPSGLSFHPATDELLVADYASGIVYRHCDLGSGSELCAFATAAPGALQIDWRGQELFVLANAGVLRFQTTATTASVYEVVAPQGTEVPALSTLAGMEFGPDGALYVGDFTNARILKYSVPVNSTPTTWTGTFATGVSALDFEFFERATVPFPLPAGITLATYCPDIVFDPFLGPIPDPQGPALIAVDARGEGPTGRNWLAPKFWNDGASNPADVWNGQNLGPVFGICLDPDGNVFVTATSAYGCFDVGAYPAGPGAVFKIDAATGAISTWLGTNPVASVTLASTPGTTTLPNTGPGLGDITYDPGYDVFYVSNLEDGRIYTVKDTGTTGVVLRAFDPFENDEATDGTPGFPELGERVYAVHSMNSRILLWSVWLRDRARANTAWPALWPALPSGEAPNNTVFRSYVMNAGSGPVLSQPAIWKVMPYLGGGLDYSNPVTDITDDRLENSHSAIHPARILVGERSYFGDCGSLQDGSSAHQARVLEYVGFSGFPPTGSLFLVGDELFSPDLRNCAGGVAYESDGDVWSTGDALDLHYLSGQPCHVAYGIERIPGSGNALSPESGICNLIDLDEYTGYYNKSQPGDVEVVHFPFSDWENLPAVCGGDVWAACPCDNPGGPDRGCANSLTPAGALLFSSGTTSVSGDSVVLQAQDMPNSTALYFQGTTVLGGGAGQPFGDGLRCAGGAVIRLGTKANVAGASQYPAPGDLPVSVRGQVAPGDLRIYQVWYRNAAAFCTPATFNLTNAIGGVWTP